MPIIILPVEPLSYLKKNVSVAYLFVCCIFIYPVPIMFSELNDRN
jgi:hypothetical protein